MCKTLKIALFIAFLGLFLPQNGIWAQQADFHVVPLPHHMQSVPGQNFVINAKTMVCIPNNTPTMRRNANFLLQYIEKATGLKLKLSNAAARQTADAHPPSRDAENSVRWPDDRSWR